MEVDIPKEDADPKAVDEPKQVDDPKDVAIQKEEAQLGLYRFLYTGYEEGRYFPVCWRAHGQLRKELLTCMEVLCKDMDSASWVLEAITHVKKTQPRSLETCLFALAMGVHHAPPLVRGKFYSAIPPLLVTGDEVLTLVRHLNHLKTGTGKGWRKCFETWYRSIPPVKLVEEVTRLKMSGKISHKNILRHMHMLVEESNLPLRVVLEYMNRGHNAVMVKYEDEPGAAEVLDVLSTILELRLSQTPAAAAAILASSPRLDERFVPQAFMQKHKVWEVLLQRMPIVQLLGWIWRLHRSQLLLEDDTPGPPELLMMRVLQPDPMLGVATQLAARLKAEPTAPPLLVYRVLRELMDGGPYMTSAKFKAVEKNKVQKKSIIGNTSHIDRRIKKIALDNWERQKHKGLMLGPNPRVVAALEGLLSRGLRPRAPEDRLDLRIMITLDMRNHMFKGIQISLAENKEKRKESGNYPHKPKKKKKNKNAANKLPNEGKEEDVNEKAADGDSAKKTEEKKDKIDKDFKNKESEAVVKNTVADVVAKSVVKAAKPVVVAGKVLVKIPPARPDKKVQYMAGKPKQLGVELHTYAKCFRNDTIQPGTAAVVLALYLSGQVKDVTVAAFSKNGIQHVSLWNGDNLMTLEQALQKLMAVETDMAAITAPMRWAAKEESARKVDLFVNVLFSVSKAGEFASLPQADREEATNDAAAIEDYRQTANMPHAGLVTVALAGKRSFNFGEKRRLQRRMLDIIGFDEHIGDLILAFATTAKDRL